MIQGLHFLTDHLICSPQHSFPFENSDSESIRSADWDVYLDFSVPLSGILANILFLIVVYIRIQCRHYIKKIYKGSNLKLKYNAVELEGLVVRFCVFGLKSDVSVTANKILRAPLQIVN